ncbi:Yip1 domain-containing protein [Lipomyces kononenkoae]
MSYDDRSVEPDVDSSLLPTSSAPTTQQAQPTTATSLPPPYTPTATPMATSSSGPYSQSNATPESLYMNTHTVVGDQIQDRRFAGGDTLDEPVWETLMRDVRAVGRRVKQVLYPKVEANVDTESGQIVREWDLWGPLIFCLFLSLALSISAPAQQTSLVFSGVFAFVWIAEAVVTVNIKLLGGSISFFQSICILGYALFPLIPGAIFSIVVKNMLIRFPIDVVLIAWSLFASVRTLKGAGVREGRVVLAMYPVWLFYGWLGWLCVIT